MEDREMRDRLRRLDDEYSSSKASWRRSKARAKRTGARRDAMDAFRKGRTFARIGKARDALRAESAARALAQFAEVTGTPQLCCVRECTSEADGVDGKCLHHSEEDLANADDWLWRIAARSARSDERNNPSDRSESNE